MASDEKIRELYELWYEQKEMIVKIYREEMPPRLPLSSNKEFKTIRIADMYEEIFSKTAYIKLRVCDEVENIKRDLDKLYSQGYRYIFMDEITLMKDFIDSAALFSDIYVPMGMKIVLSGTDSLGFWIAHDNELYDRARMLHTTYIPYREYSRLLGIDSIDDYIRYGGTLTIGETNFDDEDIFSEDASFRDDESTRRYIDTAITEFIRSVITHTVPVIHNTGHKKSGINIFFAL